MREEGRFSGDVVVDCGGTQDMSQCLHDMHLGKQNLRKTSMMRLNEISQLCMSAINTHVVEIESRIADLYTLTRSVGETYVVRQK